MLQRKVRVSTDTQHAAAAKADSEAGSQECHSTIRHRSSGAFKPHGFQACWNKGMVSKAATRAAANLEVIQLIRQNLPISSSHFNAVSNPVRARTCVKFLTGHPSLQPHHHELEPCNRQVSPLSGSSPWAAWMSSVEVNLIFVNSDR